MVWIERFTVDIILPRAPGAALFDSLVRLWMTEKGSALIILNEAASSLSYVEALSAEGYHVEAAVGVRDALAKVQASDWDIAFVDLKLPDGGGYDIVRLLAASKTTGIVVLGEKDLVVDRLEGYSRGADIYLIKPVGVIEIVAAAGAVLRRKRDVEKAEIEARWLLELSSNRLKAPNGATMQLSEREFAFMNRVMGTPGQPVERDELQSILAQNTDAANSRSLDMFVARFRKRLEEELNIEAPILTVRSIGFLFRP